MSNIRSKLNKIENELFSLVEEIVPLVVMGDDGHPYEMLSMDSKSATYRSRKLAKKLKVEHTPEVLCLTKAVDLIGAAKKNFKGK